MPKEELYLIDGNAIVHRAYHAIQKLSTSSGEATNAVYGTLRILLRILKKYKPEYAAVFFDYPAPNFRHKDYPAYKATRKKTDDALKNQFPIVKDFVRAMGLPLIELEGFEADDLIASAVFKMKNHFSGITIITGDKDILQVVGGNVKVLNEPKDILCDEKKVLEEYKIPPSLFADYLALVGDTSDNVPGVSGIGPVAAADLINKAGGGIDKIYTPAMLDSLTGNLRKKIQDGESSARLSLHLVTLRTDAPVPFEKDDYRIKAKDSAALSTLIRKYEFASLVKDFSLQTLSAQAGRNNAEGCLLEDNFERIVITDVKKFQALLEDIGKSPSVALDLETTSVKESDAAIVGIALALSQDKAYYIPVGHTTTTAPPDENLLISAETDRSSAAERPETQMAIERVLEGLRTALLENEKIEKVCHNLKYEMLVLRKYGITLAGPLFDTMVASYVLNPSRQNHGLKDIVFEVLGVVMTHIDELLGKGKNRKKDMSEVSLKAVSDYAASDAHYTFVLKEKFLPQLKAKKLDKLFYDIEMPLVAVLADMEEAGIKIDASYFRDLSSEFERRISSVEKEVFALAGGVEFNLNSPRQLAAVLFEKLKLPTVRRTKTGFSTDEETLKVLSRQHELPRKILVHRELSKLKSTYVDAMLESADPRTGRIHSSFNQTVTATGRLSSSDPNLQNIPVRTDEGRKIRRGFIAEEGRVLISADYSQIDLRVLAHLSGDRNLCEAFLRGEDIHKRTAMELFGVKETDRDFDEKRRAAKTINFGIIYGMGAFALSQSLGIDQKTAAEYIENYFSRYPDVKKWVENILASARRDGYVSTLFNRIRYIPEINSANQQIRAQAERIAVNTPVQGTSADIIKVAMIKIHDKICRPQPRDICRMLVQVHDELLFEADEKSAVSLAVAIKEEMESAVKLSIPVVVDVKKGANWDEMEKIKI